jgi:sphingomyelin phosphodiesterase acid-like 3
MRDARMLLARMLLAALVVWWAPPAAAQDTASAPFSVTTDQGLFLILTDIHFDPFTDPDLVPELDKAPVTNWPRIFASGSGGDFQGYGSDAGYALTNSALRFIAGLGMKFDYVLYTGDYLSHRFVSSYSRLAGQNPQGVTSFGVKTTQYVSNTIRTHVGDIPILGVLGNTDSVCGDYRIAPESPLTAGIRDQWAALSKATGGFEEFDAGGYYAVPHPTVPEQDIIVLNNIFWSPKYINACNPQGGSDPGSAMMAWLERQLSEARQAGRKAQILLHVPPGINAYSSAKGSGTCNSRVTPFWRTPYGGKFLALIQEYAGTVDYTFSGHTHMDSFTVLTDAEGKPLVASHITPAISPIFGNNPAFTVFLYDRKDGTVLDAATYYLANLPAASSGGTPDWKLEYVYRVTYGVQDMSAASLSAVASRIAAQPATRQTFETFYAATTKGSNPINGNNWRAYTCAQTAVDATSYAACYCGAR